MLISKTAMVRWNGFTRKWYEEKGYQWTKLNELFECKMEDIQRNSTVKVEVKCDYCGETYYPEYRRLLSARDPINKDCCNNRGCMVLKSKERNLIEYGVDNHMKLEYSKEQSRKRQQRPFKLIIDQAKDKNLILLTTEDEYSNREFDDTKSRIRFICNDHSEYGEQNTLTEVFLKNKGCCYYGRGKLQAESRKLNGADIYQAFIDKGMIPKFKPDEYSKNNQMLPFICIDHIDNGIQYKNYVTLLSSPHKCNYCAWEFRNELLRIDRKEIADYYESRGLILEDINEYENKDKPIKFKCVNHPKHIQQVSYAGLKKTKIPCEYCRVENSLTKLNRNLRSSLKQWKKDSIKFNGNQCILTGEKTYDVHHLQPFNLIIKEALEILGIEIKEKYTSEQYIDIRILLVELHNNYPLGVCISNKFHVLFHQLYSKESSIEDFEEFKKRYFMGEFTKILKEVG